MARRAEVKSAKMPSENGCLKAVDHDVKGVNVKIDLMRLGSLWASMARLRWRLGQTNVWRLFPVSYNRSQASPLNSGGDEHRVA